MRYNQGRLPDGARKAFFLGDGAGVGKASTYVRVALPQMEKFLFRIYLFRLLTPAWFLIVVLQGRQIAALIKEYWRKVGRRLSNGVLAVIRILCTPLEGLTSLLGYLAGRQEGALGIDVQRPAVRCGTRPCRHGSGGHHSVPPGQ